jgi:hypothetical protein
MKIWGKKMIEDVFELAQWIIHSGDYEPTADELAAMKQRYAELNPCNPTPPNDLQALATALLKAITTD